VRKPLVANQLTCVTLHDSYWQLEHFVPYPFSPIELVVVLFFISWVESIKLATILVFDVTRRIS